MTDRLIRLQALNETLTNEKAALQMRLSSEIQVSFHTFFHTQHIKLIKCGCDRAEESGKGSEEEVKN